MVCWNSSCPQKVWSSPALKQLNLSVLRETLPIPRVDETLAKLVNVKVFFKAQGFSVSFWEACFCLWRNSINDYSLLLSCFCRFLNLNWFEAHRLSFILEQPLIRVHSSFTLPANFVHRWSRARVREESTVRLLAWLLDRLVSLDVFRQVPEELLDFQVD